MSRSGARVLLASFLLIVQALGARCADDLRDRADACAARGDHAEAARCYRETAAYYRHGGDEQAALVLDAKADQYEPVLIGFRSRLADPAELRRFSTGAKGEPVYGCYIGANCDSDDNVGRDPKAFWEKTSKRHALVYDYSEHGYTDGHLLDRSAPDGPWIQIATELSGPLSSVCDDDKLQSWARSLAAVGAPVFLRCASEMNGDWVQWHGDPAAYISRWRIVHDVMERLAPNVAMVWCPNATPAAKIDAYYPGDAYVDWVGVNFYVVSIHDNDPRQPAERENPADLFAHVYRKYADRKPLMICETGVSHQAAAKPSPEEAFAEARLGHLYGCLPRLYPRVKAICYYDVNNLAGTATGRPFNNYLLTDSSRVLEAYKRAIAPDYFLSGPQKEGDALPHLIERLADGQTLTGRTRLSAWARSYYIAPPVAYKLDGQTLATVSTTGSYDFDLDCNAIALGEHTITLTMLDQRGGKALREVSYRVKTQPGAEPPPPTPAPVESNEPTVAENAPTEPTSPAPSLPSVPDQRLQEAKRPMLIIGGVLVLIIIIGRALRPKRHW